MTKENLTEAGNAKRASLKKLALGSVYAVPVVAAFNVDAMAHNLAKQYYGKKARRRHRRWHRRNDNQNETP